MINDGWDIAIAGFSVIFLIVIGLIAQTLGFLDSGEIDLKELEIDDSKDLLLLNYVKVNTDSGKIYDLILDAETSEKAFEDLKRETDEIMGFGFARSYGVIILYPDGEKILGKDEFEEYQEIKIPSKNGELILVKLGIEFREDWV